MCRSTCVQEYTCAGVHVCKCVLCYVLANTHVLCCKLASLSTELSTLTQRNDQQGNYILLAAMTKVIH